MNLSALWTATAIALCSGASASPLQTAAPTGHPAQVSAKASWLHLISGDDESGDDDEDDCESDAPCTNTQAPPQTPSTPPKNELFGSGKAPVVKSN